MADLIDREQFRREYALGEHCRNCERYGKKDCDYPSYSARDFCGWLDDAPAVDAVAVVRCKDCLFWHPNNEEEGDYSGKCMKRYGTCENEETDAFWFCADGEMEENG